MTAATAKIAFQGEPGAYSQIACETFASDLTPTPCGTFEEALAMVADGTAERAMLPIENSLAGRVADIHHLLPQAGLNIVAEHFLPIQHQLLVAPGTKIEDLKIVRSHAMAIGQCREVVGALSLTVEIAGDTAGAARRLQETLAPDEAVIASSKAAEIYGLEIIKPNVEDAGHNTTRFLVMSRAPAQRQKRQANMMTSFVFQVRNIPAALYKGLGGFATNSVNMTKLESYQLDGSFSATMFYADIEGHPEDKSVRLALEELSFFSSSVTILGVYPSARQHR